MFCALVHIHIVLLCAEKEYIFFNENKVSITNIRGVQRMLQWANEVYRFVPSEMAIMCQAVYAQLPNVESSPKLC